MGCCFVHLEATICVARDDVVVPRVVSHLYLVSHTDLPACQIVRACLPELFHKLSPVRCRLIEMPATRRIGRCNIHFMDKYMILSLSSFSPVRLSFVSLTYGYGDAL